LSATNFNINGLTDREVLDARKQYGLNIAHLKNKSGFVAALTGLIKEPMFILLAVAGSIYFITGNTSDGIFMLLAIVLVSAISIYQDSRSRNALEALQLLTRSRCKVIRNGKTIEIKSEEIVTGDLTAGM
jgi:Ca2+-transporting ATPase